MTGGWVDDAGHTYTSRVDDTHHDVVVGEPTLVFKPPVIESLLEEIVNVRAIKNDRSY